MPTVSALVPSLNEGDWIDGCLRSLSPADEVIVADGGSSDDTRSRAARAGARVVESRAGRGIQLRAAAAVATGHWLLFIHADTRLDAGWRDELDAVDGATVGGAFRFALDAEGRRYRWIEKGAAWRCRTLQLPYGDQGLFVRHDVYDRMGGVTPLPALEDIDLAQRLRREGPLVLLRTRALTSVRRWQAAGFARTSLRNWLCLALCVCGVPPGRMASVFADGRWGRSGRTSRE